MHFFRSILHELRPTLRLAAPITAGQVGQMLMGVADTVMIGQVGTLSLAACSFANSVIIVIAVTGFGILTAISIHVSNAFGGGKSSTMSRVLYAGISLAFFCGIVAALALHAIYPLTHHLGQAHGVVEEARNYLLIVGWSLVPAFVMTAMRNYLDAQSRPWPAFWIMFGGVILNVFLNWILIYGKLGFPAMGLTGAAWATFISRIATVFGMVWIIWSGSLRPSERFKSDLAWIYEQLSLLRLGIPAGLQLLSEVGAFAFAAILIGRLGAIPLAAHQIAITCASTSFMVPLGISMASTVRIAQAVGAKRYKRLRPIAVGSWGIGLIATLTFGMIFLTMNKTISAAFIHDPDTIRIAATLLIIAGIFQLVDGIQVIASGLLRGLRDTKGPMLITIAAYWCVALPIGSWLAFWRHEGAQGMWSGLAAGLLVAAILLVQRYFAKTR